MLGFGLCGSKFRALGGGLDVSGLGTQRTGSLRFRSPKKSELKFGAAYQAFGSFPKGPVECRVPCRFRAFGFLERVPIYECHMARLELPPWS